MGPSSRLPVNSSHCHKIDVVSSGYFLLSSTKDIQSFRRYPWIKELHSDKITKEREARHNDD